MKIKIGGQMDQDIARACGYITDDKYIASYFGVDIARVAKLRSQRDKQQAKHRETTHERAGLKPKVSSTAWNSDAERKSNADARQGSAALLKALNKFFEKRQRGESK